MPIIALAKCQAAGNDFVLFDERAHAALPYPRLAQALCDRRFGIGADGLLVVSEPDGRDADVRMRIFNADGSEAEMSGNGIRCVWRYIARERGDAQPLRIATGSGIKHVEADGREGARVDMGVPRIDSQDRTLDFDGRQLSFASVSMGNPHAVAFVERPLETIALEKLADGIARAVNAMGINVEIVRPNAGRLDMRVHERGVGETWACGTGACAAAAVAIASGRARSPVGVVTKGGEVTVAWAAGESPVYLSGAAHLVFDTHVEVGADGRVHDARANANDRLRTG
jgi:diaminopimelate epimerase